jgi:hypothetical protein
VEKHENEDVSPNVVDERNTGKDTLRNRLVEENPRKIDSDKLY